MRGRHRPGNRQGQALVELCLTLPMLIAWAAGLLDVGMIAWVNLEFTGASAEVTKVALYNNRNEAQLRALFDTHLAVTGTTELTVVTSLSDPDLGGRPSATITMKHTFPAIGLAALFRKSGDMTFTSIVRTPVMTGDTPGALIP